MKQAYMSNFIFLNVKFHKSHYTDCRSGSPVHYLAYMRKGTARIVSDHNSIQIGEGDLFYIPKNLPCQSYWYGSDEIDFLSCGFQALHTTDPLHYKLQLIPCDSKVKQELESIFSENDCMDCRALSRFYHVMAQILPMMQNTESKETLLAEKIKACIEEHPHAGLSEVAKLCGISEPYLYAQFKKATNQTPNEYRQQVLCEEGIQLLLTTNKKIEEISQLTQFSSASYFRKVLKKHTGCTPKQIRKMNGF